MDGEDQCSVVSQISQMIIEPFQTVCEQTRKKKKCEDCCANTAVITSQTDCTLALLASAQSFQLKRHPAVSNT